MTEAFFETPVRMAVDVTRLLPAKPALLMLYSQTGTTIVRCAEN
jgi:hypothetical protein